MTEATPNPNPPPSASEPLVRARLHELARLLRGARHLRPSDQQELAALLDELADELGAAPPSPQVDHLAQTAAQVARDLHEQRGGGPIDAARQRLTEAAARAEAKAPVATGLALRVVDLLAEIGI